MKRFLAAAFLILPLGAGAGDAPDPAPAPVPAPPPAAPDAALEQQPIGKPVDPGLLTGRATPAIAAPEDPARPWKMAAACLLTGLLLGAGIFFLKRVFPSRLSSKSNGLMEVLGRTPVGPKQSVVLLRVAGRVLVVGVGPDSMTALADIGNPEEVEKILLKESRPPAHAIGDFRARLTGALAPFRRAPLGAFGGDATTGEDGGLEGEIRSLERRVASWRTDVEENGPGKGPRS